MKRFQSLGQYGSAPIRHWLNFWLLTGIGGYTKSEFTRSMAELGMRESIVETIVGLLDSKINMKKQTKPKLAHLRSYQEDLDFINIECAKKKMSQPEFIQALIKVYKGNWKV